MKPANEYLEKIADLVHKHRWMVQGVLTNPSYSYTVGLHSSFGLPEVVIVGLNPKTAQAILNDVARSMSEGNLAPIEGQNVDRVLTGFPVRFVKLSAVNVGRYLRVAVAFGQTTPAAWQLMWPDPQGRFAGEVGVDEKFVAMQNLALTDVSHDGPPSGSK